MTYIIFPIDETVRGLSESCGSQPGVQHFVHPGVEGRHMEFAVNGRHGHGHEIVGYLIPPHCAGRGRHVKDFRPEAQYLVRTSGSEVVYAGLMMTIVVTGSGTAASAAGLIGRHLCRILAVSMMMMVTMPTGVGRHWLLTDAHAAASA